MATALFTYAPPSPAMAATFDAIARSVRARSRQFRKQNAMDMVDGITAMPRGLTHLQPTEGFLRCRDRLTRPEFARHATNLLSCLLAYRVLRMRESAELREMEAA